MSYRSAPIGASVAVIGWVIFRLFGPGAGLGSGLWWFLIAGGIGGLGAVIGSLIEALVDSTNSETSVDAGAGPANTSSDRDRSGVSRMWRILLLTIAALVVAIGAGCTDSDPIATPTPTTSSVPPSTATPTDEPTPTATPVITQTSTPDRHTNVCGTAHSNAYTSPPYSYTTSRHRRDCDGDIRAEVM